MIADLDQTTFGMLDANPALMMPIATSPQAAYALVERALGECDQRAALYKAIPESPQNILAYNKFAASRSLELLPRVLVILDEASAVLAAMGGAKSPMGQALASLGWRGRKFGLHFVFAAQEFTKDLIGPVRDQVGLSICFRVRNAEMAKRMGCPGAERIPDTRPGLAITDRMGPMQAYFLDPSLLTQGASLQPTLTETERVLFRRALTEGGRLGRSQVVQWSGSTEWQARKWLEGWALRGWVAKDAKQANSYVTTAKVEEILSNHPTPPTGSNPLQPPTASLQPVSSSLQPLQPMESAL